MSHWDICISYEQQIICAIYPKYMTISSPFNLFSLLQWEIIIFNVFIWLWNTIFPLICGFHYFHLLSYFCFLLCPWWITNFSPRFEFSFILRLLKSNLPFDLMRFYDGDSMENQWKENFWTLKRQIILTLFISLVYSLLQEGSIFQMWRKLES